MTSSKMRDIQGERDLRNMYIDKVGVREVYWPIQVLDRAGGTQDTVAKVSLSVMLPRDLRGTHMSRFIEVLGEQEKQVTFHNMENLVCELCERMDADEAHVEFDFPYFIAKAAPVSGVKGRVRYDARFYASITKGKFDLITELAAPIQTLCPCSKEISDFGAHNQRAHAVIAVRMNSFIWMEELAEITDSCASAPVYSVLKREDEKAVTERAYQSPRFVEDTVRDLALAMEEEKRISWFRVSVTSHESIHNHDAFACIERVKYNA